MRHQRFREAIQSPIAVAMGFVALAVALGIPARGQVVQATGPLPSFEVATIKPAREGRLPAGVAWPPPNVFRNFNFTARDLVQVAYGLPPGTAKERVLGGPGWIDGTRYDVDAKIPDATFAEMQKIPPKQRGNQMCLMVQALLKDRFKLATHIETQERPIYELVLAKGGPKMTPAKELPPDEANATRQLPPPGTPPRPENMRQGLLVVRKTGTTVMEMTARGQTLEDLTQQPFFGLGSPILNKTGLTGKYDFILDWTPDRLALAGSALDLPNDADAPSLFTALQEQLGLRLVLTKGPVEVVVIDHIEMPSEN